MRDPRPLFRTCAAPGWPGLGPGGRFSKAPAKSWTDAGRQYGVYRPAPRPPLTRLNVANSAVSRVTGLLERSRPVSAWGTGVRLGLVLG